MPHQDQFYSIWIPKSWDDFRNFMIENGHAPETVPTSDRPQEERYNYLDQFNPGITELDGTPPMGTVRVRGVYQCKITDHKAELIKDLPYGVYVANWDGDKRESVVDPDERGKLWFGVGIELTGRYYPQILDIEKMKDDPTKIWSTGREDVFEVDLKKVQAINRALEKKIKRPVSLVLMVNFY